MGGKYTEAQAKATAEYMKDKKTIRVVVTVEKHKEIQKYAVEKDGSMNAYINRLIEEDMAKDQAEIEPVSYQEYLQSVKRILDRNRAEREQRKKEKGE